MPSFKIRRKEESDTDSLHRISPFGPMDVYCPPHDDYFDYSRNGAIRIVEDKVCRKILEGDAYNITRRETWRFNNVERI